MDISKNGQKQFGKGEVIFRQGEESLCMFDILSGSVGIYADYGTEKEKLLTTLSAGEFFGEMGMIEGQLRSASAVAAEDGTQLEVITPEGFAAYFEDKPAKVLLIMRHMSQRIRDLTGNYLDACRAVTEVEETAASGKEKSGWFKAHVKKFVDDYNEGLAAVAAYDLGVNYPPMGRRW